MRNWRVLTAIVAVVLAALAGVLVWKYTDDQKQQAKEPFEFVTVLKAKSRVPANTSFDRALDAELIVADEEYVRRDAPPSYVDGSQNPAQLKQQYAEKVVSHDIPEGGVLVQGDLVSVGETRSGLAGQLSTDEQQECVKYDDVAKNKCVQKLEKGNALAMAINVDDTHAVGGFLQPGDRVNMIVSVDIGDLTAKTDKKVKTTAFLLAGIKVLAVGDETAGPKAQTAAAGDGTTQPTNAAVITRTRNIITVEVNPRQAAQIAHATASGGQLYLTMNPSTYKAGDFTYPAEIVEAENMFDQPLPLTDALLEAIRAANPQ